MKTWNRSDLNAIVAACRTAARRVLELCDRFGTETYLSTLDALLDRNYRAMAQLIRTAVPTERLEFTDYVCDDGRGYGPYKIHCSMQRVGDKVVLDFDGTDPQAEGSINFYLNENMLKMFFGIYMIMVFDPQILWNDGFYPLVEVKIPEGRCSSPATRRRCRAAPTPWAGSSTSWAGCSASGRPSSCARPASPPRPT